MRTGSAAVCEAQAQQSGTTLVLQCEREQGTWIAEAGPACEPSMLGLAPGQSIVLGAGADADIRAFDAAVSSRHCSLSLDDGRVVVRDLGSKNGVHVAGARVEWASLGPGTCFTVGRTVVVCRPTPHRLADPGPTPGVPGLVAASVAMRHVVLELARLAQVKGAVLFLGETGAGKDVLARALHWLGPRRNRPYVPLNVGTVSRELADSELFGHERGAFTGALGARDGAFVEAHTGTLFLDEIAELPHALQVKLLRVLEDGEVRPLGARALRKVDVRVTSATWAPLDQHVAIGAFRQDLYQRLSVFVVQVPPLRHRHADIPPLSRQFLDQLENEVGPKQLSPGAISRLAMYAWPGNVRELRNVLYRAALKSQGRNITAEAIADSLHADAPLKAPLSGRQAHAVLEMNDGNISAAARHAGVPRSTFRDWMKRTVPSGHPALGANAYGRCPENRQALLSERTLESEADCARGNPRRGARYER